MKYDMTGPESSDDLASQSYANLVALQEEFGDQFLGYTSDISLAEGRIIPKLFILRDDWVKMVRGVVGASKFYVRRVSNEKLSKEGSDFWDFICIRIIFVKDPAEELSCLQR